MIFLDVNKQSLNNAEKLQHMLDSKKNVFILVHMIGCAPCKNTLPEWNKLKGNQELKHLNHNDDIVIANVEQSMCQNLHNTHLEDIMSFPTIKHIKHNNTHEYNDERNTAAFSKWINSIVQEKDKKVINDVDDLFVNNRLNNINHGNIDMLFEPKKRTRKRRRKRKSRPKSASKSRPKSASKSRPKSASKSRPKSASKSRPKSRPRTVRKSRPKSRPKSIPRTVRKSRPKSASKSIPRKVRKSRPKSAPNINAISRRDFQSPLNYTKSLPI